MTQDFASKSRKTAPRKSAKKSSPKRNGNSPWVWFFTGMLCGIFATALAWLGLQQPDEASYAASQPLAAATEGSDADQGPRFDFYTLLPEQKVEVEVDEAEIAAARSQRANDEYLLQAGSFKLAEDADRRRAELLLLGLEAHVEDTTGDNGRWFRVYIGPFESRSKLAKARSLTAQQGIDTLLLKRPKA